jgi:hypothetical protein
MRPPRHRLRAVADRRRTIHAGRPQRQVADPRLVMPPHTLLRLLPGLQHRAELAARANRCHVVRRLSGLGKPQSGRQSRLTPAAWANKKAVTVSRSF